MLRKFVVNLMPDDAGGGGGAAVAEPPAGGEKGNIPASSTTPAQDDAFGDAFAELEKIGREEEHQGDKPAATPEKPAAEKPDAKPKETARDETGKFTKQPDKPAEKAKSDEAPKDEEIAPEKMAPKQLREAYGKLNKQLRELKAEQAKAKTTPPADDPEKKTLQERLEAREKEYAALQDEIRFTAYERSAEYKEKYEKPFLTAWQAGQERASKLKVVEEKNPETQEVLQPARAGTQEDFDTLMRILDDDEAATYAAKLFGPKAPMLLFHRERVQEANQSRRNALEEFKKTGSEREKQFNEQRTKQAQAVRTMFEAAKNSGIEKYPQYFKPDEADPKTKELLEKGFRLADRAFGAPDEPGEKPLTPEQRIQLQAAVRNSYGAFQRVAYDLRKQSALVKELRAKLDEYEESDPNKGGEAGKGGGGKTSESAAQAALAAESPEAAFDATFGKA